GLVGERARDGLPDPPRRVGRKPRAALGVEFFDRAQQAEVALLDEVWQRQPAIEIAPRDLHDQAQVRFDHSLLGRLVAGAHTARELVLLLPREQRDARDLREADAEACAAGLARLVAHT